jgi:hypothetical protein
MESSQKILVQPPLSVGGFSLLDQIDPIFGDAHMEVYPYGHIERLWDSLTRNFNHYAPRSHLLKYIMRHNKKASRRRLR